MQTQNKKQRQKAGMYLHIPFCHRACSYCDFYFSTSVTRKSSFLSTLLQEIELRQIDFNQFTFQSIYIGGGTPSILSILELESILSQIAKYYTIDQQAEICIELNPEDVNEAYILGLKRLGFTRVSLGTQTFQEVDLSLMNRKHTAKMGLEAIEIVSKVFSNYSIDIIYGFNSKVQDFDVNIAILDRIQAPHISAYQLTIETGTPLFKSIEKGEFIVADEFQVENELNSLIQWVGTNNYRHYETSNFCKIGLEAKHNSQYWEHVPYVGFGPSAHSFSNNRIREFNVPSTFQYIQAIETKDLNRIRKQEILSSEDIMNEIIMMRFRTDTGISKSRIAEFLTSTEYNKFLTHLNQWVQKDILEETESHITLKPQYRWQVDYWATEMWIDSTLGE